MPDIQRLLIVLVCFDLLVIYAFENRNDTSRTLSRTKRYLVFPEGSNMQLVYCLTFGTFITETDVVVGATAALAWELPTKIDTEATKLLHRRSRSVMFPKIEAFLQSTGLDGRACVMKALCEAAQRDPDDLGKGTLVQEILHAIFTSVKKSDSFDKEKLNRGDWSNSSRRSVVVQLPVDPIKGKLGGWLPRDGGRFERSQDQAYEHAYRSSENCGQLYPTCQHSIYDLDF